MMEKVGSFRSAMVRKHFYPTLLGALLAGAASPVCAADNGKALFNPEAYNAGTGGGPGIGGTAGTNTGAGPGSIGGSAGTRAFSS
jgi:hypothetical protein